nr:MAG TPA: hypothetical protein [Caudoviricetes sp.]
MSSIWFYSKNPASPALQYCRQLPTKPLHTRHCFL